MREYDALKDYPQSERIVGNRAIENRILASYRGKEFFDGHRDNGYGGMKYDGRWAAVAQHMCDEYSLIENDTILQINCEKGFLLAEFAKLGMKTFGVETSSYARRHAHPQIKEFVKSSWSHETPVDFLIAIGTVYMLNLSDAMQCIRHIEESSFDSFITLAAYNNEEDLRLLKKWSLLASTILRKDEWVEVLEHCCYTGDYSFVTAESLKLCEAPVVAF